MYYLNTRYYDPDTCRFINADIYITTGQGLTSFNMFAYCLNNPVNYADPSGTAAVDVATLFYLTTGGMADFAQKMMGFCDPRQDLIDAPDLDVDTADPTSYNCYGNGIGKQINTDPTGYSRGDSTEKTFVAVTKDLGPSNVRRLYSINDYIGEDEFKVAMKCGPFDYHFIRLTDKGWYNKSGSEFSGLYIDENLVTGDVWLALWINNGIKYYGDPRYGFPYYDDETIYFAVKVGWDA